MPSSLLKKWAKKWGKILSNPFQMVNFKNIVQNKFLFVECMKILPTVSRCESLLPDWWGWCHFSRTESLFGSPLNNQVITPH